MKTKFTRTGKLKLVLFLTLCAVIFGCAIFLYFNIYNKNNVTAEDASATQTEITAPERSATATAKTSVAIPTLVAVNGNGATLSGRTVTATYNGGTVVYRLNGVTSNMTASANTIEGTDAGTYSATVSLKDTTNYQWSDGTTSAKSYTLKINRSPTLGDVQFHFVNGTANVSGNTATATYTGSAIVATLTCKGVSFSSNQLNGTNVGTYSATATPGKNYAWTDGTTTARTVSLVISPRSISDATVADISAQTYTGSAIKPQPSVTLSGYTPTYSYSYANNTNAGTNTASVTVSGTGNFTGSVTKYFTISPRSISSATVTLSQTTYTYDGTAKKPTATVTLSGYTPTYSYSYANNTNAGTNTASVTVSGTGNFTGSVTKYFTINKAGLSLSLSYGSLAVGGTASPTLTGNSGSGGVTYSVSNGTGKATIDSSTGKLTATQAGTVTVSVTVKETTNYNSGSTSVGVTIKAADITPTLSYGTVTYGTKSGIPTVGGNTGSGEVSYSISTTGCTGAASIDTKTGILTPTKVGTVKVTVTIGATTNYNKGTKEITVTIGARSIANANVTPDPIPDKEYTGSAITPTITLTDKINGSSTPTTLTKDTDYTVAYTQNTAIGTATITITGKGNYSSSSTKTVTFSIVKRSISPTLSYGTVKVGSTASPTLTNNTGGGTATYSITSANGSTYASINSSTGVITAKQVGTITVKVAIEATATYAEGEASVTVSIQKADITPDISYKTVTYGTISDVPTITGNTGSGTVTFSISTTGCTGNATVNSSTGALTPTKAGTVKVKVTIGSTDNYNGAEKEIEVNIAQRDISNATVAEISDKNYTGSAITPTLSVSDTINGSTTATLAKTTDYTVEYTDNVDVGRATVTLTGTGNYTGTQTVYFTIVPRSISNATVDTIAAVSYDGNAKQPVPTVTDGSKTLEEGVDYSITYENNVNVGTAKIILTGIGNYNGTKEVNFSIQPPTVADATVTLSQTTYTYDGTPKTPRVTSVSVANLTLVEGTDFTVTYSANTNAGTAKVIITGAGDYDGTKEVTFTISPADISSATVSGLQIQYTYTGNPIQPTITVSLDGKDLVENTDYLVAYTNDTDVGDATVTVTGSRNYTGTLTDGFTIVSASISTATVTGVNTSYEYTGSAITPVPVVTWNGTTLVKDKDYSVTYGTNTDLGDGTVTITGLVNFNGTINKTFTITPADISTAQISGIDANYTYTGTAITPAPTVTFGSITLNADDYTVTYANNTAVGTATVTVTGKGNYTGTVSTTFDIGEADLSGATVEGINATYEYTGSAITPDPVVKLDGATLVKDTDYTVTYTNNVDVGTATVTITGKGNYELTVTESFGITAKDIASATIEGYDASYTYTGAAIQPTVTVKLDGVTLTLTTEYTVAYVNNTSVGTATITVTGTGNYTGTATATFEITGADITGASIEGVSASYPYTGNDIEPTVTVKIDGATLTLTTDYTVTYSDNLDVGTATITVTGAGNYTGTASTTFEITKATPDVTVEFTDYDGTSVRYAGTAIPDIDYTAIFGGNAITGTLSWTGNILVSGTTDYGWEFVPDNENLDKVTGSKFVNVVAPNIAGITVKWKNGTQPDLYTSTTLEQVKAHLKVEATLTDGNPFGNEILAGAYKLVGSWTGDETKPSKGGTYSLQVYLKDFPSVPPAILEGVVYQDVKLTGITYEVKDGQTLTTDYEGLDKFDTSKITVYASYNDGREPVAINLSTGRGGYVVVYADGHDCLWVGDEDVTLSYTEGAETKICKIENLSVEQKVFDTSGITFNDKKVTYTGKDFTLTASGFNLGTVTYSYVKKADGEPDETLAAPKATKAGVYAVTATFTFTEQKYLVNYEAIEDVTKTLTIEKAKYEDEITLPSVSVDYDNGKPLGDSVKVKNLPLGVEVTYIYKDEHGNAIAKDQIKNAGNYTVTVTFGVDEENFEPLAPITATFTVNKLDPKVSPTVGGSLISGTALGELALNGGKNEISGTFAWEDASQTLKEGRNICWYTFTPDDTTNYNQVRSYFEWDVAGEVKEEGLSAGALAGIAIAAVIAVIIISAVALVVAIRARKNSDDDGFYDEVTEADLAKY